MNTFDSTAFRRALGAFATGVTVVTARAPDGRDVGVTANSFNSVSLDPPMVLWSLNRSSTSLRAFTEGGGFAVHILAANQKALCERFAARTEDRFKDLSFDRGIGGAPLLADCAAQFQCRLAFRYNGGDHEILVGEVVTFAHSPAAPLVYHRGNYGAVTELTGSMSAAEQRRGGGELMHLLSRAYHRLFAAERHEFTRRGFNEEGYIVLRVLATQDSQTFESLARVIRTAGRELTNEIMAALLERGQVARASSGVVSLTAGGRQTMLELAAVRLAMEEHVTASFERSDVDLLKSLLRRLFKRNAAGAQQSCGGTP